jgi:hypothetical protein
MLLVVKHDILGTDHGTQLRRNRKRLFAVIALWFAAASRAAQPAPDSAAIHKLLSDASDIGLAAGVPAPEIKLKDQNGRECDRASLTGPNGLVVVFFRSADW